MVMVVVMMMIPSVTEFERKWAENPDAKELDITLLPANTDASKTDVTTNDVSSPRVSDNGKKSPSPLKQDVEATLWTQSWRRPSIF